MPSKKSPPAPDPTPSPLSTLNPQPSTPPPAIAALPVKTGPGRGRHSMPSLATASRLSVYSTTAGQSWLKAQAAAAVCASIGQWADLMAMQTNPA